MQSNKIPFFISAFLFITQAALPLQQLQAKESEETAPFTAPFTGKVTKSRVRLRLQPSLDSPVIRELDQDEMVIIEGIEDDFYSVRPPENLKAYIFRTYVLDDVVEGHNVNMRLEPTLEGHVIGQLNSGDRVEGRVSPQNNKWLEIAAPKSTRLYVSKDFIEKVGDASFLATYQRRRDEVNKLLSGAYLNSENSISGPYELIDESSITKQFEAIIKDYHDFEEQAAKANELLSSFQDAYMKKKIAYLEDLANQDPQNIDLQQQNSRLSRAYSEQQERLQQLETQLKNEHAGNSGTMLLWVPVEERLYAAWAEKNDNRSVEEFYTSQKEDAVTINGTIEPYSRSIKNEPGDYILLNSNGIPTAYLYSTQVNLQELVGNEVSLLVSPRPNNNFAFPAYFVLTTTE